MATTMENLFDTEEKRKGAIAAIRNLQENEGWDVILRVLNFSVEQYQKAINDTNSDLDEKQQWRLKVKRELAVQLLDLPNRLSDELEKNVPGPDLDPYD